MHAIHEQMSHCFRQWLYSGDRHFPACQIVRSPRHHKMCLCLAIDSFQDWFDTHNDMLLTALTILTSLTILTILNLTCSPIHFAQCASRPGSDIVVKDSPFLRKTINAYVVE
jgi:hypothetical protein